MENNNRPVFESFDQFVQFVYGESINESTKIDSLSDLQTMLGSMGMDNAGKKALTEVESLATQAGLSFTTDDLSQLSIILSKLKIIHNLP
jgi:hypothetical protein